MNDARRPPQAEDRFYRGRLRLFDLSNPRADEYEAFVDATEEIGAALAGEDPPALQRPLGPPLRHSGRRGRPPLIQHPYRVQQMWRALGGSVTHPPMRKVADELGLEQVRTLQKCLRRWDLNWADLPWDLEAWERRQSGDSESD